MKLILLILPVFLSVKLLAITGEEVLDKVYQASKAKKDLIYHGHFSLYKGFTSTEVVNEFNSVTMRHKDLLYQQFGSEGEMIYFSDYILKIDHKSKMVFIENPQKVIQVEGDLTIGKAQCKKIELETGTNTYTLSLYVKESINLPFSLVTVTVNKSNFWIKQLDFYYSEAMNFDQEEKRLFEDIGYPHLKITMEEPKKPSKEEAKKVEKEMYVTTQHGEMVLSEKYKTYQLLDNRVAQ